MFLWIALGISFLISLILFFTQNTEIPSETNSYGDVKFRQMNLSEKLRKPIRTFVILTISAFVVSFFWVINQPNIVKELRGSFTIENVGFAETSNRVGNLKGNYVFSYLTNENSYKKGNIPSDSTNVKIVPGPERVEFYQEYWYDPNIFPFKVSGFQSYEIYLNKLI